MALFAGVGGVAVEAEAEGEGGAAEEADEDGLIWEGEVRSGLRWCRGDNGMWVIFRIGDGRLYIEQSSAEFCDSGDNW